MESPLLDLSSHNPFFIPKNYSLYHTYPSKLTIPSLCCPNNPTTSRRRFCADATPPPILEDADAVLDSGPERTQNRRRIVRLAWEKLVRWSRSWRFKAKTDVLERTNKVGFNLLLFFLRTFIFLGLLKMWVSLIDVWFCVVWFYDCKLFDKMPQRSSLKYLVFSLFIFNL